MIVAGFGGSSRATAGSFAAALEAATAAAGVRPRPDRLAAPAARAEALAPLAQALGLPLVVLSPEALAAAPATPTQSAASRAATGAGSAAEAAALIAAGRGARLLAPRAISPDRLATCALAEGEGP